MERIQENEQWKLDGDCRNVEELSIAVSLALAANTSIKLK